MKLHDFLSLHTKFQRWRVTQHRERSPTSKKKTVEEKGAFGFRTRCLENPYAHDNHISGCGSVAGRSRSTNIHIGEKSRHSQRVRILSGPFRIFSFFRVFRFVLTQETSYCHDTWTAFGTKYCDKSTKFPSFLPNVTARNPKKTENRLFIFWFCCFSISNEGFFQFFRTKFEIYGIFYPYLSRNIGIFRKCSEDVVVFPIFGHV